MLKLSLKIDSIYLLRPVNVNIVIPYPNIKNKYVNAFVWALHCAMKDGSFFFDNLNLTDFVDINNICFIAPDLGNSFFVDNSSESVGCFIKNELFPLVNNLLSYCCNERTQTIGLGLSMGAYGLINWALSCPNIFDSVNLISGIYDVKKEIDPRVNDDRTLKNLYHVVSGLYGVLLDNKGNYIEYCDIKKNLEKDIITKTSFKFYCGSCDFLSLEQSKDYYLLFKEKGFDSEIILAEGSHDKAYWQRTVIDILSKIGL